MIKRLFLLTLCLCLIAGMLPTLVPTVQATSTMTASESCAEFIKAFEGFSTYPYYDYGQYTVGYGTKCPAEKYFEYKANGIPKSDAEELLQKTLVEISDTINQKLIVPYGLTFNQHQFDALVSFSYNIGTGWTTYGSTLRNALLTNATEDAIVYAFSLYCTAGGVYMSGLVTRRLCEANLFLNGIYSQNINKDYGYVYFEPNGGSLTYRVQGFVCDNMTAPAADAVKSDDTFLGWYTDLTGGTQVTALTNALTGKTLFARWQSSESQEDQNSISMSVTVTGDVVNIRKGPGTTYGISKQVFRNDILVISHVTQLTNMKWGKIQDGWICLDYTNYDSLLNATAGTVPEADNKPSGEDAVPEESQQPDEEPDTAPETAEGLSGTVNVDDFLRVRSGPGTTYGTVGYLFGGNKVEILEQKTSGTTVWGRIATGWVCMDYIITGQVSSDATKDPVAQQKPEQENATPPIKTESAAIEGKITADALRIRSKPGTAGAVIGFYYQNDRVFIGEKALVGSVYWGNTNKGWISMDYVSTNISDMEATHPDAGEKKTVIADCLRIRKDAGTGNKIAGLLYEGDTVVITDTKTVDGTVWGRVEKGWISMDYVK